MVGQGSLPLLHREARAFFVRQQARFFVRSTTTWSTDGRNGWPLEFTIEFSHPGRRMGMGKGPLGWRDGSVPPPLPFPSPKRRGRPNHPWGFPPRSKRVERKIDGGGGETTPSSREDPPPPSSGYARVRISGGRKEGRNQFQDADADEANRRPLRRSTRPCDLAPSNPPLPSGQIFLVASRRTPLRHRRSPRATPLQSDSVLPDPRIGSSCFVQRDSVSLLNPHRVGFRKGVPSVGTCFVVVAHQGDARAMGGVVVLERRPGAGGAAPARPPDPFRGPRTCGKRSARRPGSQVRGGTDEPHTFHRSMDRRIQALGRPQPPRPNLPEASFRGVPRTRRGLHD